MEGDWIQYEMDRISKHSNTPKRWSSTVTSQQVLQVNAVMGPDQGWGLYGALLGERKRRCSNSGRARLPAGESLTRFFTPTAAAAGAT
ncbi:hypothetical protein OUZ56_019754 [Daphnia magna]|uniref:Uncharacterized protein n=1 Tax=Daphnia magna TaxID=35525 RepID=A0ABQ9ZDA0_9CRUS|nr:hypothetical protein OUZ56_019754 [Daphnia magna]